MSAAQPAGGTRAAKQQAAPGKQSAAEQAAAGVSGEGVSDRDGAADGSTQPRAPVKKAAAAGEGSAGGKATAGGKGGGKGLAADKAAAAAAAKEVAEFRRQLSELRNQVGLRLPPALCNNCPTCSLLNKMAGHVPAAPGQQPPGPCGSTRD